MDGGQTEGTHRVLASCSFSKVFCLFSSSIRVTVTSFSLRFDSAVVMGRVTPRYLEWWIKAQHRMRATLSWHPLTVCRLAKPWFWGLRGDFGFKVTSICGGADTTDTRSLPTCGHPQTRLIQPKTCPHASVFALSTGTGVVVRISQLHADSRLQAHLDSSPLVL